MSSEEIRIADEKWNTHNIAEAINCYTKALSTSTLSNPERLRAIRRTEYGPPYDRYKRELAIQGFREAASCLDKTDSDILKKLGYELHFTMGIDEGKGILLVDGERHAKDKAGIFQELLSHTDSYWTVRDIPGVGDYLIIWDDNSRPDWNELICSVKEYCRIKRLADQYND